MNRQHILCLALILGSGLFNCTSTLAGQMFSSSRYGFQMDVPDAWTARETYFSFAHYSDVFVTVNNQRPKLEIHDWPIGKSAMGFGPQTTFDQMQPGEVYISIGYSGGPGGVTLRRDTVGSDLMALLATNSVSSSTQRGLTGVNLRFFKRGHWWFVSVNMKDPVTEDNRRAVMALLRSFRFVDAPVANNAWAESLAWKELPRQIQMPAPDLWSGWPTADGVGTEPQTAMGGARKVVVQRTGADYSVKFSLMGVGTWEYLVSTNETVQAKPPVIHAISVPASRLPSDLPGENNARVDTYWAAPYVQVIAEFGKRTLVWLSKDGSIEQQAAINDLQPGFASVSGQPLTIRGINENWRIKLPRAPSDMTHAGYITSTADSRVFIHERHPKSGQIALDIYIHGKRVNTVGPFWQYSASDAVLNEDGSAALLIARTNMASDEPLSDDALREKLLSLGRMSAQVVALNTNGRIQFQADCGPAVWSPVVAPNGAGVLLRPNTGTNQNDFIWFTEQGKQHSINISPNPEFMGWIPGTCQSLFSTSIGLQSGFYELIDWNTGKTLWKIACPGDGEVLGVGFASNLILFSVAEPYPSSTWHKVNESLLESGEEWVRTFYAVDVRDGKLVARWRGLFPHSYFNAERDHFLRQGSQLFYVTADEFTEINNEDIRAKKNGWQ